MHQITVFSMLWLALLALASVHGQTCTWKGHCKGDPCKTADDCDGELVCKNKKCAADSGASECAWKGHCIGDPCKTAKDCDGDLVCKSKKCAEPGSSGGGASTGSPGGPTGGRRGRLTHNEFFEGGDGGGVPSCSERYEASDSTRVVALSTGWYNSATSNGRKCPNVCIRITSTETKRSVKAKVVDECDTEGEAPSGYCLGTDIVDGSTGVWKALGLADSAEEAVDIGISPVTWAVTGC